MENVGLVCNGVPKSSTSRLRDNSFISSCCDSVQSDRCAIEEMERLLLIPIGLLLKQCTI